MKSTKKSWNKKLLLVLFLIALSIWGAYAWRVYQHNNGPVELTEPIQISE